MSVIITSVANPLVKRIRALRDRRHRREQRAFFVEGIQPVWRAVDAGADLEVLVVAPDLVIDTAAGLLAADFEAGGGYVARVSTDIFRSISERDGPTGLGAVVRIPDVTLDQLRVEPGSVFVGLYEVATPGNLGTIIRTADSFGVAGVVLVGATADPFAPQAVKATMGSLFALPIVHVDSADRLLAWARTAGLTVVTTSARASTAISDAVFPRPSLVVFGSEGEGLPQAVIDLGDLDVRIPMVGTASSLNLAVAAGIVLYRATA